MWCWHFQLRHAALKKIRKSIISCQHPTAKLEAASRGTALAARTRQRRTRVKDQSKAVTTDVLEGSTSPACNLQWKSHAHYHVIPNPRIESSRVDVFVGQAQGHQSGNVPDALRFLWCRAERRATWLQRCNGQRAGHMIHTFFARTGDLRLRGARCMPVVRGAVAGWCPSARGPAVWPWFHAFRVAAPRARKPNKLCSVYPRLSACMDAASTKDAACIWNNTTPTPQCTSLHRTTPAHTIALAPPAPT